MRVDSVSGYTPGYTGKPNLAIQTIDDPELLRLVKVWPDLPEHLRQTIRTLLNAAGME